MTLIAPLDGVGRCSDRRITHELYAGAPETHQAVVTPTQPGIVAGIGLLDPGAIPESVGTWTPVVGDGDRVTTGQPILVIDGTALEIALASDHVLGVLGVAGGIAHRATEIVRRAPAGLRIACGAWKKLPVALKPVLRAALDVAGIGHRLVQGKFVYIDKNGVAMLGGVTDAVARGISLQHGPVAVQVSGVTSALLAVRSGCGIVMVDTGSIDDLAAVHDALRAARVRDAVTLGFGNGVTMDDLEAIANAGADVVDIGRAVIDAPLWDLHVEVVA